MENTKQHLKSATDGILVTEGQTSALTLYRVLAALGLPVQFISPTHQEPEKFDLGAALAGAVRDINFPMPRSVSHTHGRDRSKTKRGATHTRSAAGSKVGKQVAKARGHTYYEPFHGGALTRESVGAVWAQAWSRSASQPGLTTLEREQYADKAVVKRYGLFTFTDYSEPPHA